MATIVPPPSKRQRTDAAERSRVQQDAETIPADAGSLRVQFYDEITGQPVGDGPVLVPVADANTANLELLINTLQGHDESERLPYRFTIPIPDKTGTSSIISAFPSNLWKTYLKPGTLSTEEVLAVSAAPQAVFRVKAITRSAAAIPGHGAPILCTQFSPRSSSRLVSGSGDNTAIIMDTDTGTVYKRLEGHRSWVLSVAWSPDDSMIATGSNDNEVRLWDPITGKGLGKPMKGHSKWVTGLSWEPYHSMKPGEPRVASSSKDCTIRVWNAKQQTISMVLTGHKSSVSSVVWGGCNLIYTGSHDKTVKVWNASTGVLVHTLNNHSHWVNSLSLSTSFVLRTGYHDHTSTVPASEEAKIAKAKDRFTKAATIQGKVVERLVSCSDDFTMYLFDIGESTKPIARLQGHQKQINYVCFSPDGTMIASCGFDNHTKLWLARDGKFVNTLRGHVGSVYQAAWSGDSRFIATASKDTTIKVWDAKKCSLVSDLPGHQDEVYAIDWAPVGDKIGSAGKDKMVRIWRH